MKTLGFTLAELIVVIVILGIVAGSVAPRVIDLTGNKKYLPPESTCLSNLLHLRSACLKPRRINRFLIAFAQFK